LFQDGEGVASTESDDSIPSLFDKISQIMDTRFNNLRYEADWQELSIHLLHMTGWAGENDPDDIVCKNILQEAFGNEYQSAAVLLLQSLTPIRFAFMDGQSRMTSLYYYERKLIPCRYKNDLAMSIAIDLTLEDLSQRWNLARTGDFAKCRIYLPSAEDAGGLVSRSYLLQMRSVSKDYMHDMNTKKASLVSMIPNNLNDCIIDMIEGYQDRTKTVDAHKITDSLKEAFCFVISGIHQLDNSTQLKLFGKKLYEDLAKPSEETFVEKAYKKIQKAEQRTLYPSFATRSKSASPMLQLLMLVLGTALVDERSRKALQSCIDNDWIVPIQSIFSEYNYSADLFHAGTFVDDSVGGKAWFKSKLYLVS